MADAAVEAPVSDATSASSPETPKASLLDRVTVALESKTDSPTVLTGKEAPPTASREERHAERQKRANEVVDPDAETGQYPRTAEGRIKYLNDQVRTYKKSVAELEAIKPDAELATQIMGYLDANGIQPEELDNTLALTALIKRGQYEQALGVLQPIYQDLLNRAGEVLPKELQEKVRLGHMTLADAKELQKARTKATNLEQDRKRETERQTAERAQQQHQAMVQTAAQATSAWERQKAAADPDWHMKQDLVAKEVKLMLLELGPGGYPKTAKDAVDLSDKALKSVEEHLKVFAPRPQPRQMATGPTSPRAKTQPKSLMEAINAVL